MLQDRGYVELRAKALRPLERGQLLSTMLVSHLGRYVAPAFTSRLEGDLDAISAGELDYASFLGQWWASFEPAVSSVAAIDTQQLRNQAPNNSPPSLCLAQAPNTSPRPCALPRHPGTQHLTPSLCLT